MPEPALTHNLLCVNSFFVYPRRHEYADWQGEISNDTDCLICGVKLQQALNHLHIIKNLEAKRINLHFDHALWSLEEEWLISNYHLPNNYDNDTTINARTVSGLGQLQLKLYLKSKTRNYPGRSKPNLPTPRIERAAAKRVTKVYAATTKGNLRISTRTTTSDCKQTISTVSNSKGKPSCLLHTCIATKSYLIVVA